jgi:hypothetical protein
VQAGGVTKPNNRLQATASSVRCAPAFRRLRPGSEQAYSCDTSEGL